MPSQVKKSSSQLQVGWTDGKNIKRLFRGMTLQHEGTGFSLTTQAVFDGRLLGGQKTLIFLGGFFADNTAAITIPTKTCFLVKTTADL